MEEILPPYKAHENIDDTKEKTEKNHFGVIQKNENKLDEMQDIVQNIHKNVTKKVTYGSSLYRKTSGGDYLMFENCKSAMECNHHRNPTKCKKV